MKMGTLFNFDDLESMEGRLEAVKNIISGGRNSNFHIPDKVFENDLENTYPDYKDDLRSIAALESYIKRLIDFDTRLHAANGMNRSMSYELMELIPDMESYSPSKFTQEITRVGWQSSLEEITLAIWAAIIAVCAAVSTLVAKFRDWFGKNVSGRIGFSGKMNRELFSKTMTEIENRNKEIFEQFAKYTLNLNNLSKELKLSVPPGLDVEKVKSANLDWVGVPIIEKAQTGGIVDYGPMIHAVIKNLDPKQVMENTSGQVEGMTNAAGVAAVHAVAEQTQTPQPAPAQPQPQPNQPTQPPQQ